MVTLRVMGAAQVAIKRISVSEDVRKYLQAELSALSSLEHRTVLKYFGPCQQAGAVYAVPEFIRGGGACGHTRVSTHASVRA